VVGNASDDQLVALGTGDSDAVDVSFTGVDDVRIDLTSAHGAHVGLLSTDVENYRIETLEGDDDLDVAGPIEASGTFLLLAGGPGGSDLLAYTGGGAVIGVDLEAGTITENSGTLTYGGVETIDLNASGAALMVATTGDDEDVTITVFDAISGKIERRLAVQQSGQVQSDILVPLVHYANVDDALPVAFDLRGGDDTLVIVGGANSQTFNVDVPAGTATIDDFSDGGIDGRVSWVGNESLEVFGLEGSDTFDLIAGAIPVFIDGGDPIGVTPGDRFNILAGGGTVVFESGPESDEGGILVDDNERISFDHIEAGQVTGATCASVPGTHADDDITIVARNELTNPSQFVGADGVQDFTSAVNAGLEILWLDAPHLYIDALSGDDDIVLRTRAPSEADWDVNVRITGGPPSAETGDQGDVVEVETPGAAADRVFYTPTSSETGTVLLDEDGDGIYTDASTDSLIQIVSEFVIDCDGDDVNEYRSSTGGVEQLVYDGEAADDELTVVGTTGDDTIIHTPGSTVDAGQVAVNSLLPMRYQNIGASGTLTIEGYAQAGLGDNLVVNGTPGVDRVDVAATTGTVTLSNTAGVHIPVIPLDVESLTVETLEGDDFTTVDLPQPYLAITVVGDGPGGSDELWVNDQPQAADAIVVTPAVLTTLGSTVTQPGSGTVTANLTPISYIGIEHLLLNASDDPGDTLTVNDDSRDNTWDVSRGVVGDLIQIAGRESLEYLGFEDVTLNNTYGTDTFNVYPTQLTGFSDAFTVHGDSATAPEPVDDVLHIFGTPAADVVTSNADTLTTNGVPITAGVNLAEVQLSTLEGGDGITLTGFAYRSRIFAGPGNDTVTLTGLAANSTIFGGLGDDSIDASGTTGADVQLPLVGNEG
ncbi:MAG: beta strand repeat-containing protein, partial [Pirellulales bacterium]